MNILLENLLKIENQALSTCKSLDQIAGEILTIEDSKLDRKLKKVIFKQNGFRYSKSCLNFFDFLKQKRGDCVNFSLLYHLLLGTLDFESEIIAVPSHTIVKVKEKGKEYLIETTDGSIEEPNFYIKDRKIHQNSISNGIYLTALTANQILSIYLNRKVRVLLEDKAYLASLNILRDAYSYCENIPELCYNLGYVYNQIGHSKKAKNFFERAIELHPNFAQSYNGLGICYARERNFEMAEACFRKSLSLEYSEHIKTNLDKHFSMKCK